MDFDPAPVREKGDDVVKPGAFRLTTGSAVATALVALGTGIDPVFKSLFSESASNAVRAAVLIAAIGAFAVIAAADILARSYATAQQRLAKARAGLQIAPVPEGMKATKTKGDDVEDCLVAAVRTDPCDPEHMEFLVVNGGIAPEWVPKDDLRF